MSTVTIYGTHSCPFCVRADLLLQRKGVSGVQKLWIDENLEARVKMHALTGRRSVPQIFIGEHHVGGYDDLVVLDRSGKLDQLLAE